INELLERIINQNEQTLGLFYLEPDGDLKLAVGAVALLRVTIVLLQPEMERRLTRVILKLGRSLTMRKPRKNYTPVEKVAILRRHLIDHVPVSDLCDE